MVEVIEAQAQWDAEAGVWWAESAEPPGPVSEAPTLDALIERVSSAIPDLLAAAEGPLATGSPPRRVAFRVDRMVEVAAWSRHDARLGRTFNRDIRVAPTEAGCRSVRSGKGSHEIWWSPIVERHVNVPASCVSRHAANAVLRQAGLPERF